mmetsp:Transcript_18485/g.34421  ORF Transcript_18485/g.34421 Transcript_18485/m.34421 type:complete len:286 (-) Transcript_18485:407-1264(-)
MLLPPMRPREFSIASSPSMDQLVSSNNTKQNTTISSSSSSFSIELCVAIVQGTTRLGRHYHGLCSEFLSRCMLSQDDTDDDQYNLNIWIRPGTFGKLPLGLSIGNTNETTPPNFEIPIICVGAGTGIAPMRSLLLERNAVWSKAVQTIIKNDNQEQLTMPKYPNPNDNILVFGCRKQTADYYYEDEWESLIQENRIRLLNAFSRDQVQRVYVQKVLREADDGNLIATHILERGGAVYIAGGPKMARGVKEEILEVLAEKLGGEKQAARLLNQLQRAGRFSVEAWS